MSAPIRRTLTVAASLLVLLPSTNVTPVAAAVSIGDPDDRHGRLDITSLQVNRRDDGSVAFTIGFDREFENGVLLPDRNFIAVFLNLDGDPEFEITGGTRGSRGEIDPRRVFISVVMKNEIGLDITGDLTVRRPDLATLRWVVPDHVFTGDPFTVMAQSAFKNPGGSCDPTCIDFTPEVGEPLTVP